MNISIDVLNKQPKIFFLTVEVDRVISKFNLKILVINSI